jgi:DNA polymerase-3 subunit gamma/tau
MLSQSALMLLSKTLEEPPKHAIFYTSHDRKACDNTHHTSSRCQIFDFKRITKLKMLQYLKYIAENQGINAEEDASLQPKRLMGQCETPYLFSIEWLVVFFWGRATRKAVTENLNVYRIHILKLI